MNNLQQKVKATRVSNAVAVGTTAVNTTVVDMQGYDGVVFVVACGTITDGTPVIKVQQGQASNLSDAADLINTGVTLAATDDNKLAIVDVYRPVERYVRCVVDRTIGSPSTGCVVDSVVAIQYGAIKEPTTHDSTVALAESHVSPIEGTA